MRRHRRELKVVLAEAGVEEKCAICGQVPVWNGQLLVLPIDHIDGNRHNNKITNIRYLCPNCHSQTESFAGRNCLVERVEKSCGCCGTLFVCRITEADDRRFCSRSCAAKANRIAGVCGSPKINWVSNKVLLKWKEHHSNCWIAEKMGCTEASVRKRMKKIENR